MKSIEQLMNEVGEIRFKILQSTLRLDFLNTLNDKDQLNEDLQNERDQLSKEVPDLDKHLESISNELIPQLSKYRIHYNLSVWERGIEKFQDCDEIFFLNAPKGITMDFKDQNLSPLTAEQILLLQEVVKIITQLKGIKFTIAEITFIE